MSPHSSELLVDLNVKFCLQLFQDCCHYFSKEATFSFTSCLRRSVIGMLRFSLFLLVILTFAEWPVIQDSHSICAGETGAGVEMEDMNSWRDQKEALRGWEGRVSSLPGDLWKQGKLPLPSVGPGWPCLLLLPLFLAAKEIAANFTCIETCITKSV